MDQNPFKDGDKVIRTNVDNVWLSQCKKMGYDPHSSFTINGRYFTGNRYEGVLKEFPGVFWSLNYFKLAPQSKEKTKIQKWFQRLDNVTI